MNDWRFKEQRWSPQGHNLKSLALASKPTRPQKCPVLSSRTALFFDLLKVCQGHDQFCVVLKNTRELAKNFLKTFFPGKRLKFPENLQNFGAKTFFLEITSALCS